MTSMRTLSFSTVLSRAQCPVFFFYFSIYSYSLILHHHVLLTRLINLVSILRLFLDNTFSLPRFSYEGTSFSSVLITYLLFISGYLLFNRFMFWEASPPSSHFSVYLNSLATARGLSRHGF